MFRDLNLKRLRTTALNNGVNFMLITKLLSIESITWFFITKLDWIIPSELFFVPNDGRIHVLLSVVLPIIYIENFTKKARTLR